MSITTYPHPACMEPDGGDGPCRGFVALNEALDAHKIMLTDGALREGRLLVEGDRLRARIAELTEEILSLRAYS